MHISGFAKNSLIDFPGALACVVFTPGCNFTCPYCHNPDLAAGPVTGAGAPEYTETAVFEFLERRKGMLEGVAITGGEPTLQKDLEAFITRVREMGYRVKLDSNGTRPRVLQSLLDKDLVDYLAMDIKTDLAHYPALMKNKRDVEKVEESIDIIRKKAPAFEFRTTCARPFVSPDIMTEIGRLIQGAPEYVLQKCSRNVDVLDPGFMADEGHFFTDKEMTELKAAVAPFVQNVKIR